MHRTRNAAYGQPYRGFESPPLRHRFPLKYLYISIFLPPGARGPRHRRERFSRSRQLSTIKSLGREARSSNGRDARRGGLPSHDVPSRTSLASLGLALPLQRQAVPAVREGALPRLAPTRSAAWACVATSHFRLYRDACALTGRSLRHAEARIPFTSAGRKGGRTAFVHASHLAWRAERPLFSPHSRLTVASPKPVLS